MRKMVKKKKLKVFRLLLVILILGVIGFGIDLYLNTKINNITITGTNYLKDDYILKLADLENYPSFYYTTSHKIIKKLKQSPYINKVTVKKGFYHTITINVVENKALLILSNNNYVLSNKQEINLDTYKFRVPKLMNNVPSKKYNKLLIKLSDVNEDILGRISEITYIPNEYDKDRFLLYMDDGNMVYLTLTKFEMINYYNDVLKQLGGRKGILYLDSGNHFKIVE